MREARLAVTRSGSRSIGRAVWGTATNITPGVPQRPAVAAYSTAQLTAGSLGALPSAYPIPLYGGPLMWRRIITSLSVPAIAEAIFGVSAQAMRTSRAHLLSTRLPR